MVSEGTQSRISKLISTINSHLDIWQAQTAGWLECSQALVEFVQGLPEHDLELPLLACQAAGGQGEKAGLVFWAWSALHLGVVLLDKVLDRDEIGDGCYEEVAALSSGPLFAAYRFLEELGDPSTIQRAAAELFRGFYHCAWGQYLDVKRGEEQPLPEALRRYWKSTLLKAGSVYQAGLAAGAAVATDSKEWIEALGKYGYAFGVVKQVLDDCHDALQEGHIETTLPVLLYLHANGRPFAPHQDKEEVLAQLIERRVPETIGEIVEEWQRRAIVSLATLPPSKAVWELEKRIKDLVIPEQFRE